MAHPLTVESSASAVKPFAAFDIDGSFFKSSWLEKIVAGCIAADVFPAEPFEPAAALRREWQWRNTETTYQQYLGSLVGGFVSSMAGIKVAPFMAAAEDVIANQWERTFTFPRRILSAAQNTHRTIAISGSPQVLVDMFNAKLQAEGVGFHETRGATYPIEDGRFVGHPRPVGNKGFLLKSMVATGKARQPGSVALGDTIADTTMLEYAANPIMFNPSQTLADYGRPRGWTQVLEVKDHTTVLVARPETPLYEEQFAEIFMTHIHYPH